MPRQAREVPWVEERDGVYYACWYEQAARRTRRKSLRTRDSTTAAQRFAGFLADQPASGAGAAQLSRVTVRDALDAYLREHVNVNCVDVVRQSDAAKHLTTFFGDTAMADVDIPRCRLYAEARRAGAVGGGKRRKGKAGSDSTIRRELGVLSAAANHAIRWKRMSRNEAPQIERPAEARVDGETEAPWLTKPELDMLMMLADGDLADFITLAYYTGARRRSIEHLLKSQVKLAEKRIHLSPPGDRKTKKRRPIVPIFSEMAETVERRMKGPGKYLFGEHPRDMYQPFRRLCVAAGLEGKSNPHILRHSRATHLLQAGWPIWKVAKLLGDTVATVERVYGHACPEYLAEEDV